MKRIWKAAVASGLSLGIALSGAGSVHADSMDTTLTASVKLTPPAGGVCQATVTVPANSYYAHAVFLDQDTTITSVCQFELGRREKDANGNWGPWTGIGSYATTPTEMHRNDPDWTTGQYYDGPNYEVRACMREYDEDQDTFWDPSDGSWPCSGGI